MGLKALYEKAKYVLGGGTQIREVFSDKPYTVDQFYKDAEENILASVAAGSPGRVKADAEIRRKQEEKQVLEKAASEKRKADAADALRKQAEEEAAEAARLASLPTITPLPPGSGDLIKEASKRLSPRGINALIQLLTKKEDE